MSHVAHGLSCLELSKVSHALPLGSSNCLRTDPVHRRMHTLTAQTVLCDVDSNDQHEEGLDSALA